MSLDSLQTTWFVLITVLWSGFFLLEGFDFGVGMLTPFVGRTDEERRTAKETTGPQGWLREKRKFAPGS